MKSWLIVVLVMVFAVSMNAESNESLEGLKYAEAKVQANLDDFAKTDRYEYLVQARNLASSLNPRGDMKVLSPLDEGCLRLQLKVMLATAKARDARYDPKAKENRTYINISPPLPDSDGTRGPSGVDPASIKDPAARKAYEDAIAENQRRMEKANREMTLTDGVDYGVLDIWIFARGFPADSAAKKSAFDIVDKTLAGIDNEALRNRIHSESRPGLGQ